MKIKSLLLGMFACAALVACTNDDIVENDVKQPQPEELANVPAYITVSIGTSNNSSRATVNGDGHGNTENSGHENGGTELENGISEVAVIIKTLGTDGIHGAPNSGVAEVIEKKDLGTATTTSTGEISYTIEKNFKVLAGTHKVLTIVNPTPAIINAITAANNAQKKYEEIGGLYDELTSGVLKTYGLTYDNLLVNDMNIMFVNRDEVTVEAKSTNSETSPAVATIILERPVAKLAYRENKAGNTYPITITVTKQGYSIVYRPADTEAKEHPFALVKDAADRVRAVQVSKNGEDWNIVVDENGAPVECFTYDGNIIGETPLTPIPLLQDEPDAIPENQYYLRKDNNGKWIAPEFIFTPYTKEIGGDNGWKVQLTAYALINLVNDSYVIRHTANELGTAVNTFGLLTGRNYIADPYFIDKNAVAASFANVNTWGATDWSNWNTTAEEWFANTLKNVADETNGTWKGGTFFHTLTGELADEAHNGANIGTVLQYCFENGVTSGNQLHGLTTGIVFKGVVTGSEKLPVMYQYGTEVYTELSEIIKAYGSGNKAIADLKDAEGTITNDKDEIKAAGIKIYANNECYYYTNQIKHFDNGDPNVAGNMEFAIVRNNIYSLAVTNIQGIGDAAIDPNPGIENESAVGYIKVEAKMIPWIVRFNNIEF